jgi:hypothetical protein
MAEMSCDKGGAGAVIGFFAALSRLRPAGIRCVAEIGAVRNSVGSDGFATDEILTSHAGVRVGIGNTDAEGRLVLADLLSHPRSSAGDAVAQRLFSVATLTGHVGRAYGPYTAALDNHAARADGVAAALAEAGESSERAGRGLAPSPGRLRSRPAPDLGRRRALLQHGPVDHDRAGAPVPGRLPPDRVGDTAPRRGAAAIPPTSTSTSAPINP